MGFLEQLLAVTKETNLQSVNEKIPSLVTDVMNVKKEMINFTDIVCVQYQSRICTNECLFKDISNLAKQIQDMQQLLKECNNPDQASARILQRVETHLNSLQSTIDALNVIVQLLQNAAEINRLQIKKQYEEAMRKYNESCCMIDNAPGGKERLHTVIMSVKEYTQVIIKSMFSDLRRLWQDNIKCDKCLPDKMYSFVLSTKKKDLEIAEACKVLYTENMLDWHQLVEFCFTCILTPIIMHTVDLVFTNNGDHTMLCLKVLGDNHMDYKLVFQNIILFVTHINITMKYDLNDEITISTLILSQLSDKLIKMLVKNCLEHTIPTTISALSDFHIIKNDIENFQSKLMEMGFLPPTLKPVVDFASNVENLFVEKKSFDLLSSAMVIMKKDLHEPMVIGTPIDVLNLVPITSFPQCSVSEPAYELWTFVQTTLTQGIEMHCEKYLFRIICAVDRIFDSYIIFVQDQQRQLLQTAPQQIALFYNNCRYFAFELHQYLLRHTELLTYFRRTINNLNEAGLKMFNKCLDEHRAVVTKSFHDSDMINSEKIENMPHLKTSVTRCFQKQQQLKSAWQYILPCHIYNESIGYIFNVLCQCLIDSCLYLFDKLTGPAADQLSDIFKIVQTGGPKHFTDPDQISVYVHNWHKLNELEIILRTALGTMNGTWTDGQTRLSALFSSAELKKLTTVLSLASNGRRKLNSIAN